MIVASNGEGIFSDLTLIDKPDDQTQYFRIKSSLIDETTIKDVYGEEFFKSHQIEIPIKFRKCTWGEWISE